MSYDSNSYMVGERACSISRSCHGDRIQCLVAYVATGGDHLLLWEILEDFFFVACIATVDKDGWVGT